ncbi:hypothetical protein HMPREF0973_02294 [Prevotella veroralis F0319]|uniref:Uncharacterized protein n=1 Tax=Prevotella veroralis F0319 TaxID=649761 RepID=C9MRN1_9BACT|nr:hypothetical protein HMPREF0973_02294 [Prevotella veroralis F0319]
MSGQTRASVPTFGTTFNRTNNLLTRQPVHSSTLPNHNFELQRIACTMIKPPRFV